jgi:predicted DCC family thiol-disulfide oxidoreductase YuxK
MTDATLVYDDDCGFCTWSAQFVARRSAVRLVGFSELTPEMRDRLPADYEECAHLLVDGTVYSCGEAMEQAVVRTGLGEDVRPAVQFLREFGEYERLRERGYRFVAEHRDLFGQFLSAKSPSGRDRD